MAPPRTLVIVLAGGSGGRLELLTSSRAKPAVPYGGTHRLIDFPLSNSLHSAISDVWVVQQHNPVSIAGHLSNGRPWDLDRTVGGLLVLHPRRGDKSEGWHQGTADALSRQAGLIREFAPDQLVVVSADAVYRLDYDEVVQQHRQQGAIATFVTAAVDPADAVRYGVVQVSDGQISDYVYKPDEPRGNVVSNEVYVFEPEPMLAVLEELARDADDDEGLEDLGSDLLPRLVELGPVAAHPVPSYWRDVGTIDSYWESHQDLLGSDPQFRLDDGSWPIRTEGGATAAARVLATADVHNSLLAGGSYVEGSVVNSVLSRGCIVERDAVVSDSVLLPGARVEAGSRVTRAIIDDDVRVGREAQVGGAGEIAVVGLGAALEAGATVAPGERFPQAES